MKQKALIYTRVSTDEQAKEGISLDAQENLCRKYAEDNDYRVAGIYRDEGKSATTINRPALQDMLIRCQEDKYIGTVFVQETDRLARNTHDHLTIRMALKKADVKLISVNQPMLDDSPEGNMIDTILASVNQFQSDINGRKVQKALQEKFEAGHWPGWARIGYRNVTIARPDGSTLKVTKEDPEKWHLVKEGLKMYLTGNYSALEIRDALHKKGLRSKTDKKVSHSIMNSALANPFYAGIMRFKGQEKIGKHKPMITKKEHERILEIMASHNQYACRRRKYNFLLRGFVFCNICDQRYTAEKHPIKKKEYYHCASRKKHSNRGQNIEVKDLENLIKEQFKNIQFSQDFIDLVITEVKAIYNERRDKLTKEKQALYCKKTAIEKKRDIAEEKLFKGVISDESFARNRSKFDAEIEDIQDEIERLERQRDIDIDVVQEVLKLTRNIYKAYKTAPEGLKRRYLGLFWNRFLVEDKQIMDARPTPLIQELIENKRVIISNDGLRGQDSNLQPSAYT